MLIGVDYASVDRNQPPNFQEFKAACARLGSAASIMIIRGAYGTNPDPTVRRDLSRARSEGFTCGAYMYLRMATNLTPEEQVSAFADSVGVLRSDDLVPIIDVEDAGLTAEVELEYVHRAWLEVRRTYGAPPIIYTSARVWTEDLHNLPAGEMTDSPLWVAKPWPWPVHAPAHLEPVFGVHVEPPIPTPWGAGNWWMHQYQGDARPTPGFSSTVDLSRFQVMQQGANGERVRWVQGRLGMARTGLYDGAMAAKVTAFQNVCGLAQDAVIGPKTFARIAWSNGVERPLSAA